MSILWTDPERMDAPSVSQDKVSASIAAKARDRRKAALETLAQRRARGETEMIVRARRRHLRQMRRFKTVT